MIAHRHSRAGGNPEPIVLHGLPPTRLCRISKNCLYSACHAGLDPASSSVKR